MTNELTDVRCSCGDEYPADSYDAGFIAGSGMCQNCDAALPPKDICTCPSGDGSLRHPCPAHPAPVELAGVAATLTFINGRPAMCGCQVEYSSGGGEYSDVIYVTLCAKHSGSAILDLVATNRIALTPEYEGQWHADFYLDRETPLAKAEGATPAEAVLALMSAERIDPEQESVEQAGGDERAGLRAAAKWHRGQRNAFEAEAEMHRQRYENTNRPDSLTAEAEHHRRLWETASAMAANHLDYAAGFEEMARAALAQPSPESDLDPFSLAPHAEAFNEAPAEALKPEQAKAERLDWSSALLDVAVLQEALTSRDSDERMKNMDAGDVIRRAFGKLKEIRAQHDRIVGELRAEIAMLRSYESERELLLNQHEQERDAALAEVERLRQFERICEGLPQDAIDGGWTVQGIRRYAKRLEDQLKVALARVAELEKQEPVATVAKVPGEDWNSLDFHRELQNMHPGTKLYAAPVAQAQPEETPGEILAAKLIETWVAKHGKPAPWSKIVEITALATNMPNDERDRLLALDDDVDAQAQHSVPRAWLDVQAERRRHVEVEGYHGFRDSHYINYELSKAARAYIEVSWHALSGGLPCKKPESWPWMAGFKWSDGRTMLVKAAALTLAEIERLDRAAHGKEG
ncbi:TPA: hypothetical protein ACQTZZ_004973 [Pseudomonas aeruginosa]